MKGFSSYKKQITVKQYLNCLSVVSKKIKNRDNNRNNRTA